jgi:hypothetical protein
VPISPPHPDGILANPPDLLEFKLLLQVAFDYHEGSLFARQWLCVAIVATFFAACGAGA